MKIKGFLSVVFLLTILFSSCKKDEKDDVAIVTDDPRIRAMSIDKISHAFVINDTRGEIFNHDSLSYGTKIDALHPQFSGYAAGLRYQYKKDERWVDYTGADTLDFSKPVWIKAIAPDSNYTKEYKIDIRVHRYDVEGFEWSDEKAIFSEQNAVVVSQKAYFYQKKFYFFYRDGNNDNHLFVSTDNGEQWSKTTLQLEEPETTWKPDWKTLTFMHQEQTLVVKDEITNTLYICKNIENDVLMFSPSKAVLPQNTTLKTPLFTLRDNFWVIAEEGSNRYLYYLPNDSTKKEYIKKESLLPEFSLDEACIFVALSGSSTKLGYILVKNGTETEVWVMDANGNIQQFSTGETFPFHTEAMPLYFGNRLYITGGMIEQDYSKKFYETPNSGISWTENSHKFLPVEVAGGSLFEYERNKIILIGGQTKDGFYPYVRKGVLKREILEGRVN